eukprot:4852832-Amphidinium_carterae.1
MQKCGRAIPSKRVGGLGWASGKNWCKRNPMIYHTSSTARTPPLLNSNGCSNLSRPFQDETIRCVQTQPC